MSLDKAINRQNQTNLFMLEFVGSPNGPILLGPRVSLDTFPSLLMAFSPVKTAGANPRHRLMAP